jgi:hypothetical protein
MAYIRSVKRMSSELEWDEDFHRTYMSVYEVLGEYNANPREIANASGIPTYGTSYTWNGVNDFWAFCRSASVKYGERVRGGGSDLARWMVTIRHSSKPAKGSNDTQTERDDPVDDPIIVSGSYSPFRKNTDLDKDGNPIQNTAGFPYDPAVATDGNYLVIKLSMNTYTISLATWAAFGAVEEGVVNNGLFWGLPARSVKLRKWGFAVQYAGETGPYIKHDFEFWISQRAHAASPCVGPSGAVGWYTTLPNTGAGYFEGGTFTEDKYRLFKDREENPVPVGRLACDGDALSPGSTLKFNVFAVEHELNFGALPVPSSLPGPFV